MSQFLLPRRKYGQLAVDDPFPGGDPFPLGKSEKDGFLGIGAFCHILCLTLKAFFHGLKGMYFLFEECGLAGVLSGDDILLVFHLLIDSPKPLLLFFKSGLFLFGEKFLPIQSFLPCLYILPVIRAKHSALTLGFAF